MVYVWFGHCYTALVHKSAIITVLNLKGGVGKTHTSWLIAGAAQEDGRKTLLIDTDAQGNLSSSFLDGNDGQPGIEAIFHPGREPVAEPLIRHTRFEHIDIIPASPVLAQVDLSGQQQWEAADLHLTLSEALRPLRHRYEVMVIDCPPRLSLVSVAALCASDGVVIPLEAADWGAQGVVQVTELIKHVQRSYNPGLKLLGYLVSRFKRSRSYQRGYLAQLQEHFGASLFETVIPDLADFERSVIDRLPVIQNAPKTSAASIARLFAQEVFERAGLESRVRKASGSPHARLDGLTPPR